MKIIKSSFLICSPISEKEMLSRIEAAGRICYKSENKISNDSAAKFVKNLIKHGHESVIEHEKITIVIICDRAISHEIVRHRIASYSQESTRYCNYADDKFNNELTFIKPCFWQENDELYDLWKKEMQSIEDTYFKMLKIGASPQEARSILPCSLKTELAMTMNIRQWRHFLKLRTSTASHPQMREIAIPILEELKSLYPSLFEDINPK
jgi:thymidylate synthase (FAD)